MRVLGLDLGSRTIGIAISDALGIIATGVETYRFADDRYDLALNRVVEIVKEKKVEKIVLGYPKHLNGDIGEKALLCEDFKKQLSVHNRRYNNFPMRPLNWKSPADYLKAFLINGEVF